MTSHLSGPVTAPGGRRPRLPGPRTPREVAAALDNFRDSVAAGMSHLHHTYGPVAALGVGPLRWTFLFGTDANDLVLGNTENFEFSYGGLQAIAGDTALVALPNAENRIMRQLLRPLFDREHVDAYADRVLDRVRDRLAAWPQRTTVDAYAELRLAVRLASVDSFIGPGVLNREGNALDTTLEQLHTVLNRSSILTLLVWNAPRLGRLRLRKPLSRIDRVVHAEITRRRAGATPTPDPIDPIGFLLRPGIYPELPAGDHTVRDTVVSLLIASYDPTSSALGWSLYGLLANPEVLAEAKREVARELGDEPVRAATARRLKYLGHVVAEAIRVHPPVVASARHCVKGFEIHGHHIPAGSRLMLSQFTSHRSPDSWPDPERFDPDRWDRTGTATAAVPPAAYFPYGSPRRRCPGSGMAAVIVPAVLAAVLQAGDITLADNRPPRLDGFAALRPKAGLPVRVHQPH
ncbi:cytochrome P450 [Streptomyces sp. MP131-18]|uniref:cytochrome P450 n=1 Tax=Streptomyces sp. MP131-18 TaxID=1857892 RepID=UPI0009CEB6CB|nr:cytochrome P450 [Streptomyces sp. MP131-18]ONK09305.1 Epi-isozizaene 5-monooxygenase/(E)-beta-farnesene synthase [Streptomyces sp. MP131-18]